MLFLILTGLRNSFWGFLKILGCFKKEFDEHLWFHLEVVFIPMLWRANFQITLLSICLSDVFILCWAGQDGWVFFHYELRAYLTLNNDCCRWVVKLSAVQIKLRSYLQVWPVFPGTSCCALSRGPAVIASQERLLRPQGEATAESNIV